MFRGHTSNDCLAIIDEFEFEYSIGVAGAAADEKVVAFVAGHSRAEREAWAQLVAWAKVRVEIRLSQVAETPGTAPSGGRSRRPSRLAIRGR